jgi:hypothetical protein
MHRYWVTCVLLSLSGDCMLLWSNEPKLLSTASSVLWNYLDMNIPRVESENSGCSIVIEINLLLSFIRHNCPAKLELRCYMQIPRGAALRGISHYQALRLTLGRLIILFNNHMEWKFYGLHHSRIKMSCCVSFTFLFNPGTQYWS